jgi:transcriptional regulator with XRE-family HTH domain
LGGAFFISTKGKNTMKISMDLATVRAIRKKSQYDLWRATDIHQSRISLIERGYIIPTDEEKDAIARTLEVAINEIDWPEDVLNRCKEAPC